MTLLQSAFINIINLSIAASFLMLAVILLRPFLKRVPRWLVCFLWALVAVRLVVPFSLESRWSLIPAWKVSVAQGEEVQTTGNRNQPSAYGTEDRRGGNALASTAKEGSAGQAASQNTDKTGEIQAGEKAGQAVIHENDGEKAVNSEEAPLDGVAAKPQDQWSTASAKSKEGQSESVQWQEIGSYIWLAVMIAMLAYVVISYARLRIRVRKSVPLKSNAAVKVWTSDAVTEPFVLGIFRPSIYIPSSVEEADREFVLCHELAHIKRGDYLWKPLGFLILCVYWFHPLCWISYLLFCRDVEMACDEKATKNFGKEERKNYCQTLLNLGSGSKSFLTGTVAFGENGTKSRVKAILDYRKPTFWVILVGVLACLALGIFFMTSPNGKEKPKESAKENAKENVYDQGTLLPEGEVILIDARSLPGDYHFSFSDSESIKKLKDYFDTLGLESDYPERAEDYSGMTWVLEFTYSDQRTETIYHSGNMFVRNMNGSKWYKMKYEQAEKLEELLGFEYPYIDVTDGEYDEIYDFMNYFMTFPVIWDFDQQNMSGAVDYFAQKWVWTDVTDLEYDADANAFSVDANIFAEKMGQYFVMSDSALKSINEKAAQGKLKIYADNNLPWFWGFSFGFDLAEKRDGGYYVHGYNAEITENRAKIDGALLLDANTDPFLEFSAMITRDEGDGKLRLKELSGLENGPGRKANVTQLSDGEMKELADFASEYFSGSILERYDVNDLSGVFDFAAQKILQTNPGAVREMDDGRCIVPLSELLNYVKQHFYLPKGYEKCLPMEGKEVYPCLSEDGVMFLKHENAESVELRLDLPTIQNERYYSVGVYNVDAETYRAKLAAEGKDRAAIETAVAEKYPFELAVICAVRDEYGKLRLLYYVPYYL